MTSFQISLTCYNNSNRINKKHDYEIQTSNEIANNNNIINNNNNNNNNNISNSNSNNNNTTHNCNNNSNNISNNNKNNNNNRGYEFSDRLNSLSKSSYKTAMIWR